MIDAAVAASLVINNMTSFTAPSTSTMANLLSFLAGIAGLKVRDKLAFIKFFQINLSHQINLSRQINLSHHIFQNEDPIVAAHGVAQN